MKQTIVNRLEQTALYVFLGILAYVPFHIFLSTWIGSYAGVLEFTKVAKDIVMVLGFGCTLALSITRPWFKQLLTDKLVVLMLAYGLLTVVMAAIKPTDQDAELLGLVYNTRFILFFLYGLLLMELFPKYRLQAKAVKVVVGAGMLVALFGVLQYTVLPNNALERVGYSKENGVLPAFFIDNKPDLERVMSTLRDPNSLGSYLIITILVMLCVYFATKRKETKQMMLGGLVLSVLTLAFTYSRSALLGLLAALGVYVLLADTPVRRSIAARRQMVAVAATGLVVIAVITFFAVKDTYFVQNVVFHADQSTVLEDPNELRIRFWKESIDHVAANPAGSGPGTAGLASVRNEKQGTVLNENYYLQIAYEVGVVGLLLFLAIVALTAWRLFRTRSGLSLALLAALVGLSITNFLVHIWSNEAVAYTFWGLAAIALAAQPMLTHKK